MSMSIYLCREAGQVVCCAKPDGGDPNRARWPNHRLWEITCAEMNCDLTEMRSGADPNPMKEVQREEHIGLIFRNLLGSSITLGALHDTNVDGLEDIFGQLAANSKGFATQLENANIPLNVSAKLMGHEINNETFGRYSDGLALDVLQQAISHVSWK